jgi:CRISPR-associated protein Csd1
VSAKSRLRSRAPASLHFFEQRIDAIFQQFQFDDFISDRKLTPEYLLGYHCQRAELSMSKADVKSANGEKLPENEELQ